MCAESFKSFGELIACYNGLAACYLIKSQSRRLLSRYVQNVHKKSNSPSVQNCAFCLHVVSIFLYFLSSFLDGSTQRVLNDLKRGRAGFLAIVQFGSFPTPPSMSRHQTRHRRHTGKLRKRDNLLTGEEGKGMGEKSNHSIA